MAQPYQICIMSQPAWSAAHCRAMGQQLGMGQRDASLYTEDLAIVDDLHADAENQGEGEGEGEGKGECTGEGEGKGKGKGKGKCKCTDPRGYMDESGSHDGDVDYKRSRSVWTREEWRRDKWQECRHGGCRG